jgi:hypothetical protein
MPITYSVMGIMNINSIATANVIGSLLYYHFPVAVYGG